MTARGVQRVAVSAQDQRDVVTDSRKKWYKYLAEMLASHLNSLLFHHRHKFPIAYEPLPSQVSEVMAFDRESAEDRLIATTNGVVHGVHSIWRNFAGEFSFQGALVTALLVERQSL